ncbi:Uncharacterised protein [BD1-7 clade bacterium]|uniref:ImpA N-terminal domain-containing protein n=1 Tax=BD1-7 clade bacterium TaxID=2029982 RepID=A0A5S9NU34_9GAMM|nr:Uncharacterised protein [BD1-7 clade bacterium]CAA0109422.1 Uncharacterised protein [BD1-7 clade bacterium]
MELLEILAKPVSEAEPCGPFIDDVDDLESEFIALETACRGKEEKFLDEENAIDGESADWKTVASRAELLAEKTRDVRVLVIIAKSYLNTGGLEGFSLAVSALRQTLSGFWSHVHPVLDDVSDENPWRIMCLSELGGDEVVQELTHLNLVSSRLAGSFCLRDIRLAKGQVVPIDDGVEVPDQNIISAAFAESESHVIEADMRAVDSLLESLDAIEMLIRENESACSPPQWKSLKDCVLSIKQVYQEFASVLFAVDEAATGDESGESVQASSARVPVAALDSINSRADVIKALEKINEYYSKHEPSSPLPLLISRAKRLVSMDFMAILRDISPDGVSQAELLAGVTDDDE